MKIKKNGKIVNLTETDLRRIVKRTLNEQDSAKTSSLPSCKEEMGKLAKEAEEKNCAKTGKDGKRKTGCMGTAKEKVTLRMGSTHRSAPLIAYKSGRPWCKCG